jgi:hypothetical protein
MEARASDAAGDACYSKARASRFSFKAKSEHGSKRSRNGDDDAHEERASKRREAREEGVSRPSHRESRRKHRHRHRRSHEDRHPTSTLPTIATASRCLTPWRMHTPPRDHAPTLRSVSLCSMLSQTTKARPTGKASMASQCTCIPTPSPAPMVSSSA